MSATSPRIDSIEGQAAIASALAQYQGLSTLMDTSSSNMIAVPYTTITNRALIPNLANDVGVRLGINRIPTQSIYMIHTEIGVSNAPVYGVTNDSLGQIRYVGSWSAANTTQGQFIAAGAVNDYVEITFYGTALNVMHFYDSTARDYRVSVDGGAEGSNIYPSNGNGIISSRNYSGNVLLPVVSGLTLGIHTVKIRINVQNGDQFYGFEVITQSGTSSNVITNPGNIIGLARKGTLSTQQTFAYNSNFETGSLGTTGGRVLVYLKSDNTIGKAVTPVAASPSYLTSANHSSEELVRTYFWREFGAGRSDDFSSVVAAQTNAAFTLDDGTTTLSGFQIRQDTANEGLRLIGSNTGFLTLTFVGTGIDIIKHDTNIATNSSGCSVSIDGVSVGSLSAAAYASPTVLTLASGLPYGTHTVQILAGVDNAFENVFKEIRIYQPLTPILPSGAIELARYNIMANYSASASASPYVIAPGVLRKMGTREFQYFGTWTANSPQPSEFENGFNISSSTSGSAYSLVFFGTGFEWQIPGNNGSAFNITFQIDGSANLSAYTTALLQTNMSGLSFNASTGTISGTATTSANNFMRLIVASLPLGVHTVTVTTNSTAPVYGDAFDIITPIHSYKSNLPGDLQNTLLIGSQGISDSRAVTPATKQKACAQAIGVSSGPTTNASSYVPCPDMSVTINTRGNYLQISYAIASVVSAASTTNFRLYMDGAPIGTEMPASNANAGYNTVSADTIVVPAAPGFHKVDLYWYNAGATSTAAGTFRTLTVRDVE